MRWHVCLCVTPLGAQACKIQSLRRRSGGNTGRNEGKIWEHSLILSHASLLLRTGKVCVQCVVCVCVQSEWLPPLQRHIAIFHFMLISFPLSDFTILCQIFLQWSQRESLKIFVIVFYCRSKWQEQHLVHPQLFSRSITLHLERWLKCQNQDSSNTRSFFQSRDRLPYKHFDICIYSNGNLWQVNKRDREPQ